MFVSEWFRGKLNEPFCLESASNLIQVFFMTIWCIFKTEWLIGVNAYELFSLYVAYIVIVVEVYVVYTVMAVKA